MFNTLTNVNKNFFEKACGEIKKDYKKLSSVDERVQLLALTKLVALLVIGVGSLCALWAVSSLLAGAIIATSIKTVFAAVFIIGGHDAYIIAKNEQNAVSTSFVATLNVLKSCVRQVRSAKEVNLDKNILKSQVEANLRNTWFEPLYLNLAYKILESQK